MQQDRSFAQDATAPDPARIELRRLSCALGGAPILSDIDLDLSVRRIGIVGRNGSGKSTLARVICGLIAPQTGEVRINGIDVLRDRRAALRQVGILFQNPDHQIIFPTVGEEVAFGLRQLGRGKREARETALAELARFGRAAWFDRPVSTLSQGQRHLVCLIAVLAMRPKVIVLDEPYSGLDIPTTTALGKLLAQLPATIVHITHDPALIASCDHVIWLDRGRIAEAGPAAGLLPRFRARMQEEGLGDAFADLSR